MKDSDKSDAFEAYCEAVFHSLGFETRRQVAYGSSGRPGQGLIDFMAYRKLAERNEVFAVETKYTFKQPNLAQLYEWAKHLQDIYRAFQFSSGVLAINWSIDPRTLRAIHKEFAIRVWDAAELATKRRAPSDIELHFRIVEGEGKPSASLYLDDAASLAKILSPEASSTGSLDPAVLPAIEDLLQRTAPGRGIARAIEYEKICLSLLFLLFHPDLEGFEVQNRTVDRVHRFDIIARIVADTGFWSRVASDFGTRVVLFECKNHTQPVKPHEVFTTERYLSSRALRTVAFILSRKGGAPACIAAAHGALREGGKLLVCLSDFDLIEMLKARLQGSPPQPSLHLKYLDGLVYKVLAAAGR